MFAAVNALFCGVHGATKQTDVLAESRSQASMVAVTTRPQRVCYESASSQGFMVTVKYRVGGRLQ